MLCTEIYNYISTAKGLPFFYVVGDDDYLSVLNELKQAGLATIRTSDFCTNKDRFPNIDELIDYFRTSDIDYRENKFVVTGFGEYLALKGNAAAIAEFTRLKSTTLGNARVVLLLRGVSAQIIEMITSDKKILGQQRAFIAPNTISNISITAIKEDVGIPAENGMKAFLNNLENGISGRCYVKTVLPLDNAHFPVENVRGAYSALKLIIKEFDLPEKLGTEEQWGTLLRDVGKCKYSLIKVFEKHNIGEDCFDDFYQYITGQEYRNWLFFIWLKLNADTLQQAYLQSVLNYTDDFEELKNNILTGITRYSCTGKGYKKYYAERKRLVKNFPESDIAVFIKANEIYPEESVYRLTDNTLLERQHIIKWISMYGIPNDLNEIYPDLSAYLEKYVFSGTLIDRELTQYFDEYKKQKVENKISEDFMELVNDYASNHKYTKLPTRNNVIKGIDDKEHTQLYWIDALGAEYMSYITALAKKKGLSIKVKFASAELPSITSMNKQFFDDWTGGKKYKEENLDNIKHDDKGGYYFTECVYPIHLAEELKIISKAIDTAATELAMHSCRAFVIASDHGASRLAVIKRQEEKYETDTRGLHSGRCCEMFEGCDLENVIPENGYLVLSDYGRFKGSRAANVEVHGGATLEEIVVPVITLTLKKQTNIIIQVIKPNDIYVDRHSGISVKIYISDVDDASAVSMVIGDKKYPGKAIDETHFEFELPDIKRAKTFQADIYDSSDLAGKITFTAKGKTGSVKSDFDDLF